MAMRERESWICIAYVHNIMVSAYFHNLPHSLSHSLTHEIVNESLE